MHASTYGTLSTAHAWEPRCAVAVTVLREARCQEVLTAPMPPRAPDDEAHGLLGVRRRARLERDTVMGCWCRHDRAMADGDGTRIVTPGKVAGGSSTARNLRRVQRLLPSRTAQVARAAHVLPYGPGQAHAGAGGPGARGTRVQRVTLR